MTDTEFREAIKKGELSGGYLLFGDEDFLKGRYASDMCRAVAGDGLDDFNIIKAEAAETPAAALEELCAMYPLMSEKKAVLLTGFYADSYREKELSDYISLFSRLEDYPFTVLAVCVPSDALDAGTLPKRPSSLYKKLSTHLTPVHFESKNPASLKKWIAAQLFEQGIRIYPDAAEEMLRRCGKDMFTLHGECAKLSAYVLAKAKESGEDVPAVTLENVENVCSVNEEDDAFALANAVLAGDRRAALRALKSYRDRKEEPIVVTAALSRVICDMLHVCMLQAEGVSKKDIADKLSMHEYKCALYMQATKDTEPAKLRAAMERCAETDRLLKSTDLKYIAVERLVCTIPARKNK